MSIKSKISNGLIMAIGNLKLLLTKISGNTVKYKFTALVSAKSHLKTDNHGVIELGSMTAIRENTEVSATGGTISIGDQCFVNRNCMIIAHKKIDIKNGTTIGPNVCIYDHDHDGHGSFISKPIVIGRNVWIGAGCIILKGVTIGDNSIIGAGTVITKSIPDNSVVYEKKSILIQKKGDK